MSETAIHRPYAGADDVDQRTRSMQQSPAHAPVLGEALAELARLVGDEDPFRNVSPVPAPPVAVGLRPRRDTPDTDFAGFDADLRSGFDAGEASGAPDDPAVVHSPIDHPDRWARSTPRFASAAVREQRPIEPNPDLWAGSADDGRDAEPVLTATRDAPPPGTGGSRRTLVVLAAVVALTGGGLAASFLAKPSTATIATATAAAPTILAATGPSKVKPETPTGGDDTASQPSTLLDKNSNDGTAAAKVVNTVEQPVDLSQAVKPATPEQVQDAPSSAFPEPRKVKTVLVRPDGTIIANATVSADAVADAMPSAARQQANLAFDPKTALPIVTQSPPPEQPPVAAPSDAVQPLIATSAKPTKTTVRAKPMASTPADGTAAAQSRTPVAKAKVVHAPAKPKTADATPADAAPAALADAAAAPADITAAIPAPAAPASTSTGGSFSVQLGAAPSETEGHQAASRLAQKYGLGGQPGVHRAEAGGKTVYRIRVGNLSQDDAKAMCAKVKAGGGGCFIARN